MLDKQQFVAGGTILVARFVMIEVGTGSVNNRLLAATDTTAQPIVGISSEGPQGVPNPSLLLDAQVAATIGQHFEWWSWGETARVYAGDTLKSGDFVKSNSLGKGIAASDTNPSHALALEAGVADELVLVMILPPGVTKPA
jgi:hypothetical protein